MYKKSLGSTKTKSKCKVHNNNNSGNNNGDDNSIVGRG